MNPKQKAEDLVLIYLCNKWFNKYVSKQCALITVNEIIKIKLLWFQKDTEELDYWNDVKKEIQKL